MKQITLTQDLYQYLLTVSLREDPVLAALRMETAQLALALMQVSPEQGQFLQFLLKLINAKTVLELGTFTGYSALAMALALPEEGTVITCDNNVEWTNHARKFWQKANQAHKIELRLAPALQTLETLVNQGYQQHFDFIFIDADKSNYVTYYEYALTLVSDKGLIAIDNALWDGRVIDNTDVGSQTREIRRLNQLICHDERVDISLLPMADGLFLIKKR